MSIKIIKNNIKTFLSSKSSDVLAVYGGWGVGKTYIWKETIKDVRSKIATCYENYSYVSLFGINSLDILKKAIFENMIHKNLIGDEKPSLKTFFGSISSLMNIKKAGYLNKSTPRLTKCIPYVKDCSPILETIINIGIKDVVICLDDIERRGAFLSVNEILGYLNFLKEERNCKIIIIYNSEKINDDKFKELNEKVVNKRIQLDLAPKECCDLVIPEKNLHKELIKKYVVSLSLKNMRIIKIIHGLSEDLQTFIHDVENDTWDKLIEILCLFCFCQYVVADSIPNLDALMENGANPLDPLIYSNKNRSEEKKEFLRKYGFYEMTKLHSIIANGIKTGFFKEQELICEVNSLNTQVIEEKERVAYSEMWASYCGSFDHNEHQVIEDLRSGYFLNKKHMSIPDIDHIISFFRENSQNALADTVMKDYIDYCRTKKRIIRSNSFFPLHQLNDSEFKEAIDKLNEELKKQVSLSEAINYIALNSSWSPEHEDALVSGTDDEYYVIFKSLKGKEITEYYNALSVFHSSNNSKSSYQIIATKVGLSP